jgi:hypothetical protein
MRLLLPILALAAIAGCASTAPPAPAPAQVAAAPDAGASAPEQVCRKERPTGSLMLVTICEPAVSNAEHEHQLDEIRRAIRPSTPSRGSPGG